MRAPDSGGEADRLDIVHWNSVAARGVEHAAENRFVAMLVPVLCSSV
jgi:hypothetical protein